jgi:hypothetical protein
VRSATIVTLLPGETLSTSLRLTRLAKTLGMRVILDLKHDAADVVRLASQKVFDVAPIDGVPRSAPYSRLIGEVRRSWDATVPNGGQSRDLRMAASCHQA